MRRVELLDPRNDFLFKKIFAADENRDLLIHLLNAVFVDAGQPRVAEVELLNPAIDPTLLTDKMTMLDLKARTETGVLIDVEMQLTNEGDMAARTLYYWAKLFDQQLEPGALYQALHKTVTINLLNFKYLASAEAHSTFHLREDRRGDLLTDWCEIHFVELPKVRRIGRAETTSLALERWALYFTLDTLAQREVLAVGDPVMQKGLNVLEFLSQDRQVREQYEARQKGERDFWSSMAAARDKGREEGREEGRKEIREEDRQNLLAAARELLAMGASREQVARTTHLSIAELEALERA